MKTRKQVLTELLDAVNEDKIRNEISFDYVSLRHSEKPENRLIESMAKFQSKIKENDKFIAFLEDELNNPKKVVANKR
jgi:hypothetical protein